MKRFMFFILAAVIPATTFGWDRTYEGKEGRCVQQTNDGGYVIAGWRSTDSTKSDGLLIKTDDKGDTLWTRIYGEEEADFFSFVEQTNDGGYIVVGTSESFGIGQGNGPVWLMKTDSQGDTLWSKLYGGIGLNEGYCVRETSDGGYIILSGGNDLWLIKTDNHGDTLWTRVYSSEGDSSDVGFSVQETTDSGYVIVGLRGSVFEDLRGNLWLLKTDSQGDTLWTRIYGGEEYREIGHCVQQTSDGGYIVTGYTGSFSTGGAQDLWLLKTDLSGDTIWTRTYGKESSEQGRCVQQTSDGGYIITGQQMVNIPGPDFDMQLWLIKTDAEGDSVWTRVYGSLDEKNAGRRVRQTADGGYIITGYTNDVTDVWLIKTDDEGYAYHYEVSPTTIVSPQEGDTLHRVTPAAYFTNLGDDPVSEFYCHCEISNPSYHSVPYHDSVLVEDTLAQEDSVLVEFEEWTCEDSLSYEAMFYATNETSQPWSSEPASVGFYGSPFSGIVDENARALHWEITSVSGSEILLRYSGYPEGFRAFIFDATGRKVDEIKSSSCSGMVTWGECFGPGVYFIVPQIGVELPRKVILIR